MNIKERIAGFILMCFIVPAAILGYLLISFFGFFGNTRKARQGVRALDHFVNASLFGGLAWESLSSHAWREREKKWWAKVVIRVTNLFHKDHCMKSNRREQRVVDLVLAFELHEQTIK